MAVPEHEDDPTNVKPIPLKMPDGRPPKEKDTVKDTSKTKMDNNRKERAPSVSPAIKAHPLLKLNDFIKNCSEADSADSNCDFVKKVDYNSDAVSSASCVEMKRTNDHDPRAKQIKTTQLKRPDAPAVRASGSKNRMERERDTDKEKVKDKKKDDFKEKESKERKDSKDRNERPTKREGGSKEGNKLKKDREVATKGKGASKEKKPRSKEPHAHSKTDKFKVKSKEKDDKKEKSKEKDDKKDKEKEKDNKKKKKK